jgi:hypothetical protein
MALPRAILIAGISHGVDAVSSTSATNPRQSAKFSARESRDYIAVSLIGRQVAPKHGIGLNGFHAVDPKCDTG